MCDWVFFLHLETSEPWGKEGKNVKMTVRFLFFYQLCLSFNFSAQLSKWCNTAQKQLYIHFPSVLKYNSPRTALFAQPYILWKCNVHHNIPQTSKLIHTALTCSNVFCWLNTLKVATATRRTAWWESLQAVWRIMPGASALRSAPSPPPNAARLAKAPQQCCRMTLSASDSRDTRGTGSSYGGALSIRLSHYIWRLPLLVSSSICLVLTRHYLQSYSWNLY